MSLVHLFVTAYTYYINYINRIRIDVHRRLEYIYIDLFYLHSNSLRNNKLDLPSE